MIKFRWFDPLADDRVYLYDHVLEKYAIKRHNMIEWYPMANNIFDARVDLGEYIVILEDNGHQEN